MPVIGVSWRDRKDDEESGALDVVAGNIVLRQAEGVGFVCVSRLPLELNDGLDRR